MYEAPKGGPERIACCHPQDDSPLTPDVTATPDGNTSTVPVERVWYEDPVTVMVAEASPLPPRTVCGCGCGQGGMCKILK